MKNVLFTFYRAILAKDIAKHCQFRSAEALAGRCCRAYRTVVLDQEPCIAFIRPAPFGHIAFSGSLRRKGGNARLQVIDAFENGRVGGSRFVLPCGDQLVKRSLTERVANRLDQADGKLSMCIGKKSVPALRQLPFLLRPADALGLRTSLDEAIRRQFDELLARVLPGRSKSSTKCRRGLRTAHLQKRENPLGCGAPLAFLRFCVSRATSEMIFQSHAWYIVEPWRAINPDRRFHLAV